MTKKESGMTRKDYFMTEDLRIRSGEAILREERAQILGGVLEQLQERGVLPDGDHFADGTFFRIGDHMMLPDKIVQIRARDLAGTDIPIVTFGQALTERCAVLDAFPGKTELVMSVSADLNFVPVPIELIEGGRENGDGDERVIGAHVVGEKTTLFGMWMQKGWGDHFVDGRFAQGNERKQREAQRVAWETQRRQAEDARSVFNAQREQVQAEIAERGITLEDLERYRLRGWVDQDQYRALRRQGVQRAFAGGWILDVAQAEQYMERGDLTQVQVDKVRADVAEDHAKTLARAAEIRVAVEAREALHQKEVADRRRETAALSGRTGESESRGPNLLGATLGMIKRALEAERIIVDGKFADGREINWDTDMVAANVHMSWFTSDLLQDIDREQEVRVLVFGKNPDPRHEANFYGTRELFLDVRGIQPKVESAIEIPMEMLRTKAEAAQSDMERVFLAYGDAAGTTITYVDVERGFVATNFKDGRLHSEGTKVTKDTKETKVQEIVDEGWSEQQLFDLQKQGKITVPEILALRKKRAAAAIASDIPPHVLAHAAEVAQTRTGGDRSDDILASEQREEEVVIEPEQPTAPAKPRGKWWKGQSVRKLKKTERGRGRR